MVRLFIQCKFYPQTYLFLQVKTSYIADIKMGEGILQIFRWGMECYYFIKYVFRWGYFIRYVHKHDILCDFLKT